MNVRRRVALVAGLAVFSVGCEALLTRPIRYGRVVVQAETRGGEPLAGIQTILYTGARPMGYGQTDAQGRVAFSEVPQNQYGVYLQLPDSIADLSELEGGPARFFVDGLEITTGMDTTLMFTFARRGNGAAEALVRNQAGQPLENIEVFFYTSRSVLGSATTGANGIALYNPVPFGQAGAFVIPSDTLGVPGSPGQFIGGLIVDGETVARVEFTLATCFATIRVAVLDDASAPVPGMDVNLYDSRTNRRTVATNSAGIVTFERVGCGNYGVALGVARSGYENVPGRGNSFVDGLGLTTDALIPVTLRMRRLP